MDKFIDTVLLLGGNVGDTAELLQEACLQIELQIGPIEKRSALYGSVAWGFETEQDFINQAVVAKTNLPPHRVLELALEIEAQLGRKRSGKGYSSRTMDIDVIFYGSEIIDTPRLTVPHPRLHRRNFVLVPLCEISPDFVHPVFGKTIRQLLDECPDEGKVWKIEQPLPLNENIDN